MILSDREIMEVVGTLGEHAQEFWEQVIPLKKLLEAQHKRDQDDFQKQKQEMVKEIEDKASHEDKARTRHWCNDCDEIIIGMARYEWEDFKHKWGID